MLSEHCFYFASDTGQPQRLDAIAGLEDGRLYFSTAAIVRSPIRQPGFCALCPAWKKRTPDSTCSSRLPSFRQRAVFDFDVSQKHFYLVLTDPNVATIVSGFETLPESPTRNWGEAAASIDSPVSWQYKNPGTWIAGAST